MRAGLTKRAQAALARAGLELRYAPGRGIDSPVTRFFADQPPPPTAFAPLAADRVHTDEHPFYYYDLVWGGTGGYLLMGYLGTLVGAGVIAVLFLLVPLLVRRRQVRTGVPLAPISWRYHAAFGCLGAGFMLLEVGAIQRLELFLGNPTLSLVVILGLLLASAGVGSWLSGRVPSLSPKRSALGVVGYGLVVMLFLNSLMYDLMALPLAVKVAVLVIVLAPLGMLMGAIFPALVARLGGSTPRYVPWALALNGVFSVLASNLGAVVYLVLGADVVLLMGIACYGVLTATAPRAVDIPSERGDADGPALPVEVPGSIELG